MRNEHLERVRTTVRTRDRKRDRERERERERKREREGSCEYFEVCSSRIIIPQTIRSVIRVYLL